MNGGAVVAPLTNSAVQKAGRTAIVPSGFASEAPPGDELLAAVGGAVDQDCCGANGGAVPEGCQFRTHQGAVRQVDREDLLHRSPSGRRKRLIGPGRGLDGEVGSATRPASPFLIRHAFKLLEHADRRNVRPHQQINQGRDEEIGNSI